MNFKKENPAFVLGMFETGLAVARSLGRNGIDVYGFDHKKDIGFSSRYVKSNLTPHPLISPDDFRDFIVSKCREFKRKPVLFISSDDYLEFFVNDSGNLNKHFEFNIIGGTILGLSFSKSKFYQKLSGTGIPLPAVYDNNSFRYSGINYPVLIKGDNVNVWRNNVNSSNKVIIANDQSELELIANSLKVQNVEFVLQEIIPGRDDCFYKYCAYRTKDGKISHEFMLRKLRQNPVRFGVGSLVISCINERIRELGRNVFESLDYKGIGSAEFKFDERDGDYKLIELNSRYWQQNSLAEKCGINFPLVEYLYLTGQDSASIKNSFETGVKWLNIYMDFASFLDYRREKSITFFDWIEQIKGKKVFSDFSGDDVAPSFYEIFSASKLKKIPKYVNRVFQNV